MVVMDGQLVPVCGLSDSVPAQIALVEDWRQDVAALCAKSRACNVRISNSVSRRDIGKVVIAMP